MSGGDGGVSSKNNRNGKKEEEEEKTTTVVKVTKGRRESPWGRPEGDNRQPIPHRCNDRAEDIIQACFEGNPFKTVPGPFKLFWRCMRSKSGEEPNEPFYYLQPEPPTTEVKLE